MAFLTANTSLEMLKKNLQKKPLRLTRNTMMIAEFMLSHLIAAISSEAAIISLCFSSEVTSLPRAIADGALLCLDGEYRTFVELWYEPLLEAILLFLQCWAFPVLSQTPVDFSTCVSCCYQQNLEKVVDQMTTGSLEW